MFKVFKTPEFKKAISFFVEGIKENKKSFFISRLGVPQPTLDLQDLDKRGRKILYGFQN